MQHAVLTNLPQGCHLAAPMCANIPLKPLRQSPPYTAGTYLQGATWQFACNGAGCTGCRPDRAFSGRHPQARAALATLPSWLQVYVEPNPLGWTNKATALLNKYRPGAAIFVVSSDPRVQVLQAASSGGRQMQAG